MDGDVTDDQPRMMHPIDQLIEKIEAADFPTLTRSGTERLQELMDTACPIFERHHFADQATAMAMMFGILCASIEGEPVDMEREENILLSFEDRLRIFNAVSRVTYRDAMRARAEQPADLKQRTM